MQIDGVELARRTGKVHGVEQRNLARQHDDDRHQRHAQAKQDDEHLLHIRPGDRADAAGHRVEHYGDADDQRSQAVRPAKDDGKHDGRSIKGQTYRKAALHEEDHAGQSAGLGVETVLQIFVSRIHLGAMEDGDGGG